jgi:hypothetical protein
MVNGSKTEVPFSDAIEPYRSELYNLASVTSDHSFTMTSRRSSWLLAVTGGCVAIAFVTRQNGLLRETRDIQGSVLKNVAVPSSSRSVTFCSSPLPQNNSASSRNARTKHSPPDSTRKSVCRNLGDGRTSSSMWRAHLRGILEASIHPMDEGHVHQNWTKQLLDVVTPELMERALRTQPSYKDIDRIMRIIDEKMNNPTAPPLHVAVFGGSVTEGSGCENFPPEIKKRIPKWRDNAKPIRGRSCAWPYRLQRLSDHFLGQGVVVIHNLAVGGTSSQQAQPVISYWLYPSNSPLKDRGPDVIVNAYSTNDNLQDWKVTNATGDFIHFHKTLNMTHGFVETALRSRPCHDPPVI